MTKRFLIFSFFVLLTVAAFGQSESKASCNPQSCGPGGTKTEEAKVIKKMRSDLGVAISKLTKFGALNEQMANMEISIGANDDESLLFIYQSVVSIHSELVRKFPSDKLLPELKNHVLQPSSNKQQLVASVKKEIKLLNDQAENFGK